MMKDQILIAEDEVMTGQMLVDIIEDAGYNATLAKDGTEALRLLEERTFAVVVSDIRMPDADGISVLQAARRKDSAPEVILLTGYGALDTSLAALREGAFDYLLKPCKPDLLLERIACAIEARETRLRQSTVIQQVVQVFGDQSNEEVSDETASSGGVSQMDQEPEQVYLQVGELCIGNAHYDVTFAGEPLHLTHMEYALLRCMAESPGRVWRYRELVYHMHDYDVSNIEARVLLKTHVRNIRQKIGQGYLVNIRGTGYKLVEPEPQELEVSR